MAMLVSIASIGFARPAAAGDVGPLTGSFAMSTTQVQGTYLPIPLLLLCNQGRTGILWYGRGTAPDRLWTNVAPTDSGGVARTSRSVSVNGIYQPFAGDFDGNGCTDVFWYAPGAAPDYIWWFGADLQITTTRVDVNGTYIPIVGRWDGLADSASDVFWYAPGSGRESIWTGSPSRRFTTRAAPQVYGTYRPSVYGDEDILWHAPGPAPDRWWSQVRFNAPSRLISYAVAINETYQTYTVGGRPFLYRASGEDRAVFGRVGTSLTTTVGNVPGGPHVVGATQGSRIIVFHVPGPGTDHVWFR